MASLSPRPIYVVFLAAAASLFLTHGVMGVTPDNSQRRLGGPFVDRFQTIDSARWRLSDGWSNGDWTENDWRASQVSLNRTGAVLTLARQHFGEKPFSSGELQTHQLYRYGYFEARMRVPRGAGIVSGFFTYTRDNRSDSWDEIDIEILGRDTRQVELTYFSGGHRRGVRVPLPFDASEGLHSYGFEWSPARLRWYVDGRLVHEATGQELAIPDRPQRLYVHLWNSATLHEWVGTMDRASRGPWRLEVACVAQAAQYPGEPLCAPS